MAIESLRFEQKMLIKSKEKGRISYILSMRVNTIDICIAFDSSSVFCKTEYQLKG